MPVLIFDSRTTRTENDLLQATEIATNMVCRWGMSEALGRQAYAAVDNSFLGEDASLRFMMSNDTTSLIDRGIKALLSACHKQAVETLKREHLVLNALSDVQIQLETVDAEEFEIIYQCSVTKKAEEEGPSEKV